MRAQLSVDFLIALALFLAVSIYFVLQFFQNLPQHAVQAQLELFRTKAYALSELLLSDKGYPENWHELYTQGRYGEIKRLGLMGQESHSLVEAKVRAFNRSCNELYASTKTWLGVEQEFSVTLTTPSGLWISCPKHGLRGAMVERVVALGNEIGRLRVEVWQRA